MEPSSIFIINPYTSANKMSVPLPPSSSPPQQWNAEEGHLMTVWEETSVASSQWASTLECQYGVLFQPRVSRLHEVGIKKCAGIKVSQNNKQPTNLKLKWCWIDLHRPEKCTTQGIMEDQDIHHPHTAFSCCDYTSGSLWPSSLMKRKCSHRLPRCLAGGRLNIWLIDWFSL